MATKSWKKLKRSSKKSFSSAFPGQLTDCLVEADCQVRSTFRFYRGAQRWPARLPPRWPAYEATRPTRSDLGPPCFGHRTIQSFIFSLWAFFSQISTLFVCKYNHKKINCLAKEAVPDLVLPGAVPWPMSAPILNDILLGEILWSKKMPWNYFFLTFQIKRVFSIYLLWVLFS